MSPVPAATPHVPVPPVHVQVNGTKRWRERILHARGHDVTGAVVETTIV